MCTISIISLAAGRPAPLGAPWFRLVANRDERVTRPAGEPPRLVEIDGVQVAMPIDPVGGGTWIAATAEGVVFAILNGQDPAAGPAAPDGPSRGAIIPSLLSSESLDEVGHRLLSRDWRAFRPWRLVAVADRRLLTARPIGGRIRLAEQELPGAFMTTSSSFDDAGAAEHRARLFHRLIAPVSAAAQDAFHAHRWSDRPELSVEMSRSDARTVSRTVVEVGPAGITMTTTSVGSDAESVRVRIPRAGLEAGAA